MRRGRLTGCPVLGPGGLRLLRPRSSVYHPLNTTRVAAARVGGAPVGMRILVVGGGAREHALLWKLARSPHAAALLCAPGNAGTTELAESVPVRANDIGGLVAAA